MTRDVADEIKVYIETGLSNVELSDKFKQSYEELHRTLSELVDGGILEPAPALASTPRKRTIKVQSLVADIQAGSSPGELMIMHGLSQNMLRNALKKLIQANKLYASELSNELCGYLRSVPPERMREQARLCLDFELHLSLKGFTESCGTILDISEKGLGVKGYAAKVSDVVWFEISHEDFIEIAPFSFEAECRWTKTEADPRDSLSGFRITDISDKDAEELRKLIQLLTL
jgi:hypothetical protein